MSLFWSQWMPQFYNNATVRWLRSDWRGSGVRAAMAIEHDGYLADPSREKKRVMDVVDAAIAEGLYVIIDWHDHNADQHKAEAKAFFAEMARTYGHSPNVLFEVFNEPIKQAWGSTLKPYHEELVSVIRQHSNNLII